METMREMTPIEEVVALHKHHPNAIYLAQSELNDCFNALTAEQKKKSHELESEAESRGEHWAVNGWFGVYGADGKLMISDVTKDQHWPEMYSASKEVLEAEGRKDLIAEADLIMASR